MFGNNRNQQSSNEDRPVVIDGRTGRVIEDDHRDNDRRDNGQGRQERGSAHWIHDEYGNKTPYYPGQEW